MTQIIHSSNGWGGKDEKATWGKINWNILDQTDLVEELDKKPDASELWTTAFSNDYNDLDNQPTIWGWVLTIKQNDNTKATFNANATTNATAEIVVPTKVSELQNDANYLTSYTETDPTVPSHVKWITEANITSWNGKYAKPTNWIPKTDLASAVQTSLWKADTALQSFTETDPIYSSSPASWIASTDINNWNWKYTKPSTWIPKTDLATAVQTSLWKADTAVQPSQLNSFATLVDLSNWLKEKQDKALVTTLDNADDTHYPSAKAVADAIWSAWGWDMLKSVYDPTNKNWDAFDAHNFHNLDTQLNENSTYAVQNQAVAKKINEIELSKSPNVSIVWEPTILNWNISGFSASNYLIAPFLSSFAGYPFTFHMDITTWTDVNTQQNILDAEYWLAFAIINGRFVIALSTNWTSWDLWSHTWTYVVKASTSYCVEIEWTWTAYVLRVSTDRVNFTTDITVNSSTHLSGNTLYIGWFGTVVHPFGWTLNFNEWQFLSGTIVVWKGMDDAWLATRANLSLSNLNVQWEARLSESKDNYFLKEDEDYTVEYDATKWVAPYNTSYWYTNITITNSNIKEKLGATYQFSINTKPATSTYRNVRVRFWADWEWYWLWAYNSVAAQYSYFTKAYPCFFVFKESSATTTTDKYFSSVYVNTTYSAMSATEAQTWTATSARTMSAKVLADEITRREWLYHDSTKQDVISDLDDIRANANNWATAKTTVDTHVANWTIHVTASDKIAWSNKYAKPTNWIPKTDLDSCVQASLWLADSALQSYTESDPVFTASAAHWISQTDITNWNNKWTYSKPSGWIPKSDLDSSVQASLGKADTALQWFDESDPTVPVHVKWILSSDINNWNSKQDSIADLGNIRTWAWLWATAVQPSWLKTINNESIVGSWNIEIKWWWEIQCVTQAQYDQIWSEKLTNGVSYFIYS